MGSRSTVIGGSAICAAADKIIEKGRKLRHICLRPRIKTFASKTDVSP